MKKQKNILLKIVFFLALIFAWFFNMTYTNAQRDSISEKAKLKREINNRTFYQTAHNLLRESLVLEEHFNVNWEINVASANNMLNIANDGIKYLKDNLENDRLLKHFQIALRKWIKEPRNKNVYGEILSYMMAYIDNADVYRIEWTFMANPNKWSSPLNVTLRSRVVDKSWTKIPKSNMTWYMLEWAKKIRIWTGPSANYTINWEWEIIVFLEVVSSHKNSFGQTDVLPLVLTQTITVWEKAANLSFTVNGNNIKNKTQIKFTPEEAKYGLVFDPSSTYANGWATIIKTEWNFWNGQTKTYDWKPKLENVKYWINDTYTVILTITTNEKRKVTRKIDIYIHYPIAVIEWWKDEWYIWDKFSFQAKKNNWIKAAKYKWKILEIGSDEKVEMWEWPSFSHEFLKKWKFRLFLEITDLANRKDTDTKEIVIFSRPPVAKFNMKIAKENFPNIVFFDATDSYDPDYQDQAWLQYVWTIDWVKVELDEKNENSSLWYFKFDTIWDHKIVLEVLDSDWMSSKISNSIDIKSVLWVDFKASPWVALVWTKITFSAKSDKARFFKWDFGDGNKKSWSNSRITHSYKKTWDYKASLIVEDRVWNTTRVKATVYVWERWKPKSIIGILNARTEIPIFKEGVCDWKDAYIIDRKDSFRFNWQKSVNIDWREWNLKYFWKVWNDDITRSNWINVTFSKKFDSLWCIPIKLTVTSKSNWKIWKSVIWVKVTNLLPTIKGLSVQKLEQHNNPMVIQINAIWAVDPDWAIQSYLWYYYTEDDPEPQQYRSTIWPSAKFTITKQEGKYYFVVIMKDSNWAKANSEEITGSEYTLDVYLDWNNVNTPIINFKADNNNASIWDKVNFSVMAKNIIWTDISKTNDTSYYWDFDWDWKFEKWPSSWNTITHIYKKSWKFNAQVKVVYKGSSNRRILKMNVHNPLKADFDYISIWNKFIFVNMSTWKIDKIKWDMWDKKILKNNDYNIYYYKDWKKDHKVTLEVGEWNKFKEISKDVTENIKNRFKYRKRWLHVITFPRMQENTITLTKEEKYKRVYVYLWESKVKWVEFQKYTIDYDITEDSNADSKADNDIDNIDDKSYDKWTPAIITLNNLREQTIRVSLIWKDDDVYDYKDIKIVKEYIEKDEKLLERLDILEFISATQEEKIKLEEIREYIRVLPKKNRLDAIQYFERLDENWWDNSEKIVIINDFSDYVLDIVDINKKILPEAESINNILESFSNQFGISISPERQAQYDAIIKILEGKSIEDYDNVIEALKYIRDNEYDMEENTKKAKFIYNDNLKDNKTLLDDEKRAINDYIRLLLWTNEELTASWAVEPNEKIVDEGPWIFSKIFWGLAWSWIIMTLLYIFWWFIWLLLALILIFLIMYLVNNSKRQNKVWFADYIIEKTRWTKNYETEDNEVVDDIFADLDDTEPKDLKPKEQEIKKEKSSVVRDPLAFNVEKKEEKKEKNNEEVPDWLKWTTEEKKETKKEEPKKEEIKPSPQPSPLQVEGEATKVEKKEGKKSDDIPDWLSGVDLDEKKETKKEKIKNPSPQPSPLQVEGEATKVEKKEVKKSDDVPDWLSGVDLDEKKETKKEEIKNPSPQPSPLQVEGEATEKKEEIKKEKTPVKKPVVKRKKPEKKIEKWLEFSDDDLEKITDIENWDVPDWLKEEVKVEKKVPAKKIEEKETSKTLSPESSLPDVEKGATKKVIKKEEKTDDGIPDWLKEEAIKPKKEEEKADETKKISNTKKTKKTDESSDTKKTDEKKWDDLWDNGMDIPDWLQDEVKK